jgi:hypothetical protein
MENNYYLQSVELVQNDINGLLYYVVVYHNGIKKRIEHINFELSNSISIELT